MPSPTVTNASLPELVQILNHAATRRLDVVIDARELSLLHGQLIFGVTTPAEITADGVIPEDRRVYTLDLTDVAVEHIAEKLRIPLEYLRRCLSQATSLADDNVNHWLWDEPRKFYLRAYAPEDRFGVGVARALLSDRFRTIDNIDILTAAVAGISDAGLSMSDLDVSADLTERRMRLRINAPSVFLDVPDLLERYYDPRSGQSGRDYPILSAGLDLRNSDVGGGAFQLAPFFTVLVCKNGMTRTQDAVRHVHLGGKLDDGVVDWSRTTLTKALELIQAKTTDAVRTFLTADYLASCVAEMREMSAKKLADPVSTITTVTQRLHYSNDERQLILNAFMAGGDPSVFGVAQAITNVALDLAPERRMKMEDDAFRAMELAAVAR